MKRSFSQHVSLLCVMLAGMLFIAIPPVLGQTPPGQQGQPRPGEQGQPRPGEQGQAQPGDQDQVPSDPAKAREESKRLYREVRRHNPIIDIESHARSEREFREQMKQFGSPKVRALMEAIEAEMRAGEAHDQARERGADSDQAYENWRQARGKAVAARFAAEDEYFQANPQAREAYQRALFAWARIEGPLRIMMRREAERKVPPSMTATPQLHGGLESTGGGGGGGGGGSGGGSN